MTHLQQAKIQAQIIKITKTTNHIKLQKHKKKLANMKTLCLEISNHQK
jgi:hypothetical protein